ncbi:histidine kinase [Brachybacterium sp. Marseille-Q7125]|uniref:histidine kinase n=1 Tax=Brachybacterium sp. Marseille-Q7125 TaxID=2932815 RepID=UPI001FF132AD|nr:histidine kinase [Brachybacterium sp. Marseille-Q7125]
MDLRAVTDSVQDQLHTTAALGDENIRRAADLLTVSLEPALRLALQDVIGQVAAEISAQIAPGRVDVTMLGADADIRVTPPPVTPPAPAAAPSAPTDEDEQTGGATSRVTFRPPQALKTRLERAAAQEQLSLNTYLVRALTAHLDEPAPTQAPSHGAGRTSGWFL